MTRRINRIGVFTSKIGTYIVFDFKNDILVDETGSREDALECAKLLNQDYPMIVKTQAEIDFQIREELRIFH